MSRRCGLGCCRSFLGFWVALEERRGRNYYESNTLVSPDLIEVLSLLAGRDTMKRGMKISSKTGLLPLASLDLCCRCCVAGKDSLAQITLKRLTEGPNGTS